MTSQNIEYYLRWTWQLLRLYGPNLRRDAASSLPLQETLRGLLRAIKIHETETLHACEENLHLLRFVESQQVFKLKQQEGVSIVSNDENINGDMDANDIEESLENISYPILEFKQIQKYIYDHGLDKEFSTDLSAVPVSKSTATSTTIATQSRIKKSYSDDQQTAPQSIPNNNQSIELVSAVTSSALDLEGPWTSNWHDDDDADPANDISTDDDNFEGNEIDIEDNDTHTAPPSKVQKSTLGTNSKYHQQQETKSTKDHITLLDVGDGRMVEVVNVDSVMRARLLQKRIK